MELGVVKCREVGVTDGSPFFGLCNGDETNGVKEKVLRVGDDKFVKPLWDLT